MEIHKLTNIFSEQEIKDLLFLQEDNTRVDNKLGRVISGNSLQIYLIKKIEKIVNEFSNINLISSGATYIEYNNKYGDPNLPPHFDGDITDAILNFQLSSNTEWSIGLDTEIYNLEDNSGLLFHPNKNIHWRPIKKFKDGQYVKMLLFRFINSDKKTDYSHLIFDAKNKIFDEANKVRNSLNIEGN